MRIKFIILTTFVIASFASNSYAQWDWLKKNINAVVNDPVSSIKQTSLSETEIGQGLKEALKVGIDNAVTSLGQEGGYFNNPKIKIPFPENLKLLDTTLRRIGMGDKIDDFVLSMNKSAETAAPAARDIFLNALFDMNIEDAQKIFQGKDTAATDYFKGKTYDQLTSAFQPLIDNALAKYDVTNKYKALIDKYKTIPFASKVNMLSPDDYVVKKALNGLFSVLGQEEAKIRQDPAARVTDLLKKVFEQNK